MNFAWSQNLVRPYESLWSIIYKFSYLNATSLIDIYNIFGDQNAKALRVPPYSRSILHFDGLSPRALIKVLELSRSQIKCSIIEPYNIDLSIYNEYIDLTYSALLRFCPVCLELGYHSPLYQFSYLKQCPFHKVSLLDACINCDKEIPYRLSHEQIKQPYQCSCGYRLTRFFDHYRNESLNYIEKRFSHYFNWKSSLESNFTESEKKTYEFSYSLNCFHFGTISIASDSNFLKTYNKLFEKQAILTWPEDSICFQVRECIDSYSLKQIKNSSNQPSNTNRLNSDIAKFAHTDEGQHESWAPQITEKKSKYFLKDDPTWMDAGFYDRAVQLLAIFKSIQRHLFKRAFRTQKLYKRCNQYQTSKAAFYNEYRNRICAVDIPLHRWDSEWRGRLYPNFYTETLWEKRRPIAILIYAIESETRKLAKFLSENNIVDLPSDAFLELSSWVWRRIFANYLMRSYRVHCQNQEQDNLSQTATSLEELIGWRTICLYIDSKLGTIILNFIDSDTN